MNKEILNVSIKDWHSKMQQLHLETLQKAGWNAVKEHRLKTPNGHGSYRIADIFVPELNLVIEVQKSKNTPKQFKERNEDYLGLGLRVVWVFNEERWQPDTDSNPELEGEGSIYMKWRDYTEHLARDQFTYNSNRYNLIKYCGSNSDIEIYYCLPTINAGMMYRKLLNIQPIKRLLTPKFPSTKHFGKMDYMNHKLPKETFNGLEVTTSVITEETIIPSLELQIRDKVA